MKKILLNIIICIGLGVFILALLSFGIKGRDNNPNYYETSKSTEVGGPFEASNSTSRYALTESIVNNHSLLFDKNQIAFAAPDVTIYKGQAFTIFTPGVSFVGAPFLYVGELINLPQITTYLATLMFALINTVLVYLISRKLGAGKIASFISSILFLFGTNALVYAFGFTQHHYSLTMILLSLLNITEKRSWVNNILLGIFFGASLLFDIPNAIMLVPVGLYALSQHFVIQSIKDKVHVKIKVSALGILIGLLPFIVLFAVFNKIVTGSYTKLGQTIGRPDFSKTVTPTISKVTSIYDKKLALNTRNELNGLYTLLISNERSWLWYSPVLLLALLGMYASYQEKSTRRFSLLLISVAVTCIVIYSLFGDPWGGWAFGPRYLIPAAGIFAAFLGIGIDKYKKHLAFGVGFLVLASYSIYVNVLGMMTTSSIPPKVEALALLRPIPYTYKYNQDLVKTNNSKSYIYTTYLRDVVDLNTILLSYTFLVFLLIALPYVYLVKKEKKRLWI